MAQLSEYQRDILIRTALGEARGEGEEGMADVIQVILNRANSGQYPSDPAAVALQPYQFSTWNKGEGGNNPQQFKPSDPLYKKAAQALDAVVGGSRPDYTGGALFYHTPAVNPSWSREVNRYGTVERNGHVFYPSRPVPPGEIPNVVASQTDTQAPQRIVGSASTPANNRATQAAPTFGVTPRLAPGNNDIYSYRIPDQTPTRVVGGLGSLTPDRAPPPLPRPRPVTDRDIANVPYSQGVNVPLTPSVPRQLPALPQTPTPTSQSVIAGIDRGNAAAANVDPGLRAALERQAEQRAVASVPYSQGQQVPYAPSMVDTSMQRAAAAVDPALQRALEARNGSGVGQPPATRSVASVPVPGQMNGVGSMPSFAALQSQFVRPSAPMPTTAIPGPSSMPKGQERLMAGVYPMAPNAVPNAVPQVGTALDVVPGLPGFPPLPRPRPVQFSMPTPVAQRPQMMPSRPLFGMPTPVSQRPTPNALRVTVNGAGSYSAPARAPTPTREQQIAAILARSRGPAAFGGGGTIDGAVQPIGTLTGRR